MSWVWLAAGILSELGGTLSLRASDGLRQKIWIIPLIIGYGLSFLFLTLTLAAGMGVGIAYGVWAAIAIALVAVLAHVIWDDPLTKRMIAGIVVIAIGVILVQIK